VLFANSPRLALRSFLRYPLLVTEDFSDATLVILGHGTELNAESAAPARQHAAELRQRRVFAEVREAFWKQEPRILDVMTAVKAPRVFIAPLFISEGYFSEDVIPRALGFRSAGDAEFNRVRREAERTLFYCQPVGTHESMTRVILARAEGIVRQFPFPRAPLPREAALFIAGHGTERNENSRRTVERQVEFISQGSEYGEVHAIFLDEEPRIPQCYHLTQKPNLIIVPFFISDGLHVAEDIPVLLGAPERVVKERLQKGQPPGRNPTEKHGRLVWYTRSVGTEPSLADIILERVTEAAGWTS